MGSELLGTLTLLCLKCKLNHLMLWFQVSLLRNHSKKSTLCVLCSEHSLSVVGSSFLLRSSVNTSSGSSNLSLFTFPIMLVLYLEYNLIFILVPCLDYVSL